MGSATGGASRPRRSQQAATVMRGMGGTTNSMLGRIAESRMLPEGARNWVGRVNTAISPGSGGAWAGLGAVPAPVVGLAAGTMVKTALNAINNWQVKPEDKFPAYYAALEAEEYKPRDYFEGDPTTYVDAPSVPQIAQNTKYVQGQAGVPFVDDVQARQVQRNPGGTPSAPKQNEAFVYKDKPYVMLSGDQARNLGLTQNQQASRYGVALNRYQNARSAARNRRTAKADENRGGK